MITAAERIMLAILMALFDPVFALVLASALDLACLGACCDSDLSMAIALLGQAHGSGQEIGRRKDVESWRCAISLPRCTRYPLCEGQYFMLRISLIDRTS